MLSPLSTLDEGGEDDGDEDDDVDSRFFLISHFMGSLKQVFKLAVFNIEVSVLVTSKSSILLELMQPFHQEMECSVRATHHTVKGGQTSFTKVYQDVVIFLQAFKLVAKAGKFHVQRNLLAGKKENESLFEEFRFSFFISKNSTSLELTLILDIVLIQLLVQASQELDVKLLEVDGGTLLHVIMLFILSTVENRESTVKIFLVDYRKDEARGALFQATAALLLNVQPDVDGGRALLNGAAHHKKLQTQSSSQIRNGGFNPQQRFSSPQLKVKALDNAPVTLYTSRPAGDGRHSSDSLAGSLCSSGKRKRNYHRKLGAWNRGSKDKDEKAYGPLVLAWNPMTDAPYTFLVSLGAAACFYLRKLYFEDKRKANFVLSSLVTVFNRRSMCRFMTYGFCMLSKCLGADAYFYFRHMTFEGTRKEIFVLSSLLLKVFNQGTMFLEMDVYWGMHSHFPTVLNFNFLGFLKATLMASMWISSSHNVSDMHSHCPMGLSLKLAEKRFSMLPHCSTDNKEVVVYKGATVPMPKKGVYLFGFQTSHVGLFTLHGQRCVTHTNTASCYLSIHGKGIIQSFEDVHHHGRKFPCTWLINLFSFVKKIGLWISSWTHCL